MPLTAQSQVLILPTPYTDNDQAETQEVATHGSVVVVGANGSGKTRLGAWMEFDSPQRSQVHRVGAQRSLAMPREVAPATLESAELAFLYGEMGDHIRRQLQMDPSHGLAYKRNRRWSGHPSTSLVSDYDALVHMLFAEQYDAAVAYREGAKSPSGRVAPGETRLDRVVRIWEQVLPHRRLVISGGKIEAVPRHGGESYSAAEMSDGERVVFYLIGQCLAVKGAAMLVVDEPEIHLHRAIQAKLWDEIERERADCLFVYLTHDLDFAASRASAKKVWLKSYENGRWDWQLVPSVEGLPEEVLLTVLGSRKPILFTEGDSGGLEQALLSQIYLGWNVVPLGGCERVIAATTAFSALKHLHGLNCQGIIDRDFRTERDVEYLEARRINVLPVHEIENLLLVREVLGAVADYAAESQLIAANPLEVIEQILDYVLESFRRDKVRIASALVAWRVEHELHRFDAKAQGSSELRKAIDAAVEATNVEGEYSRAEVAIDEAIRERNFENVLRIYGNKGLVKNVGRFVGLPNAAFLDVIKRLVTIEKGESILIALRTVMPALEHPSHTVEEISERVLPASNEQE
jgi:hypothetical protein